MRTSARILTAGIAGLTFASIEAQAPRSAREILRSPDDSLIVTVGIGPERRVMWSVDFHGQPVIKPSALGIVVDGVDLSRDSMLVTAERYRVDEKYPWRGVKSEAIDRANGLRLVFERGAVRYTVDLRASNDAVAFRHVVPGSGRRVPDSASSFSFPAGSIVWSHGLRDHYEAVYERRQVELVPEGDWAAPPITVKLAGGIGYAAVTEADLRNYAGMALEADGRGGYAERLAHDHPAGYPYTLRFGEDNAARLAVPAPAEGTIITPWRVVIVGRDLHALVNSDAVHNLCPPPDPRLFPNGMRTAWIKPGRAVWRYLDGGENTVEGIKEFSRLAGQLGFEHQVVEGQWQRWTPEELQDVVAFSKSQGIGIWVWRHRNTLEDPEKRRALFASLHKMGIVGVKVDFLDHEAKEVIDLYQDILRDAAAHQLMIDFHGANKPTGEPRTWPNELTREGIYGLEHRRMSEWATFNTTFPFVRMLAGHADYTPVVFGERRRETSWAHQIASAVILTSPLLVYGGHPSSLLSNPAADMIKSIPSVWDETRVLPPSAIGELAMFARRSGSTWFVAAMNGRRGRTVKVDLSFLPRRPARALLVRDNPDNDAAVVVEEREINGAIEIPLRDAGGFVLRVR